MTGNLLEEIVDLARDILNECQKRADYDLVPLFQRVLHLSRLVKNRSVELWALSELEGYQSENVLQATESLSKTELNEYKNLRRLRSFPDDCFLASLKDQFLVTGELVATEPGRATLTMPLKELEMSYLTDREYYKHTYSVSAPLSLSLLERAFTQMKNRIYSFASEIYLRYHLAQDFAGIFDAKLNSVNHRLAELCPKVLKHLNQSLESRTIDKDRALSSLKEALKEFAQFLQPTAKLENFDLSDQFFINRICQFFEERAIHAKASLLKANYRSLILRCEAIYQRLKESNNLNENEIEGLIIQTYFFIADTLDFCTN